MVVVHAGVEDGHKHGRGVRARIPRLRRTDLLEPPLVDVARIVRNGVRLVDAVRAHHRAGAGLFDAHRHLLDDVVLGFRRLNHIDGVAFEVAHQLAHDMKALRGHLLNKRGVALARRKGGEDAVRRIGAHGDASRGEARPPHGERAVGVRSGAHHPRLGGSLRRTAGGWRSAKARDGGAACPHAAGRRVEDNAPYRAGGGRVAQHLAARVAAGRRRSGGRHGRQGDIRHKGNGRNRCSGKSSFHFISINAGHYLISTLARKKRCLV